MAICGEEQTEATVMLFAFSRAYDIDAGRRARDQQFLRHGQEKTVTLQSELAPHGFPHEERQLPGAQSSIIHH